MMQNFSATFIRIMARCERKPQLSRRREVLAACLTFRIPRWDSYRISPVLGASSYGRAYLRRFAGYRLSNLRGAVSPCSVTNHVAGQNKQGSKHCQKEGLGDYSNSD